MDSIAIAFWKRPALTVTVDYGQLASKAEIRASEAVCAVLNIEHHIVRADLSSLGSGDLAGSRPLGIAPVPEWWPFRNQMLITLAAMKLVPLGCDRLMIGCLKTDGFHADGTSRFIEAASDLLEMQEGSLTLVAPAIGLTAPELIKAAKVPLDVLAWAHSCHTSDFACGDCNGCRKHYETFSQLGLPPY
ncbi:7-cyano-7-deazaguanine synthase [Occallatibacter riparius]|uniref:7-cyano-7-deazaguanine synthase n=2 Tax=Occallatibacter riparius TaxID=1002689 RepID=A0A9J7BRD6_9BACT|nr:7-cyano-7-deazaguanine synthase [Occallatibacter riparius]